MGMASVVVVGSDLAPNRGMHPTLVPTRKNLRQVPREPSVRDAGRPLRVFPEGRRVNRELCE